MAALFLAPALLVSSAQAGSARQQSNKVKLTVTRVATLAMDGARVAYASGGKIYVWNVDTGATSVVKGEYSNATHTIDASQVAIAGKRVAWIKRVGYGNTEEGEKLYTAQSGGSPHVLKQGYIFGREDSAHAVGGWIAGVVGAGKVLAVSTWKSNDGATSDEKLSLIGSTQLHPIVTGPGAIVAEAANGGHIAVLRSLAAWPADEPSMPAGEPTVGVYGVDGTLLREIVLDTPIPPPPPCGDCVLSVSTIFNSVALSGNRLVVLTQTNPETAGSSYTTKLEVYDWSTGALLQTWPVASTPFGANAAPPLSVYNRFAVVEGRRLLVLDLTTGNEIMSASTSGSSAALDSHGLVYAERRGRGGKLIFVPMSKLLALVG